MATDVNEISDVEELIRQTGMDSSDTAEKIVDYFKNKRAALQSRARLYDGSDNSINFRLENLQPVQLPQTNSNLPRESSPAPSSNVTEAASNVLVKPLSELSVSVNRVPSFMSPGGVAATSAAHIPRKPPTNIITSPTGRSTVHVSPIVSIPNAHSARTNLQKQLLLQQYKRKNQMKCEAIRNASQLASSTPIAGKSSEQRGNNLLDIRETISPIHEDQGYGTPQRALRSPNVERDGVDSGTSNTNARSINTPVPATQDVPDGMDQDYRENTPPRDDNPAVVIPETPSPVRRSPRVTSTPLSGLSLQNRPHAAVAGQGRPIERDVRTPCRSILKNSDKSFSSRNRVSFSEKLVAVRSMTPAPSSDDSQVTSDESEEQDREQGEPRRKKLSMSRSQRSNDILMLQKSRFMMNMAKEQIPSKASRSPDKAIKPVKNSKDNQSNKGNSSRELTPHCEAETSVRNDKRNVQHSRRMFENSRSDAIECMEEPSPESSGAIKRSNNRDRTNSNAINMIMEDWEETVSKTMHDQNGNRSPLVANRTINKSLAITNIDTPRTVMMDIFDPPSAFCDESQQGDDMDCSRNDLIAELNSDAPGLDRSDPSRKSKQNSIARQGSIDINEPGVAPNPEGSMVPTCVSQRSMARAERIVSLNSPHDHIPLNMIEAVDMIHSRVNSDIIASEPENDRRITLNIPTKRRTTKLKLDTDTEEYIKTIEAVYSQDKVNNKSRRNRRKLFAQEVSDGQDSNCDEPQPLPSTQDVAETQDDYVIKPLSVVVQRLSATTLSKATKSTRTQRNAELGNAEKDHDEQSNKDVQSPIAEQQNVQFEIPVEPYIKEKQNQEQNEMEDRSKFANRKTPPVGGSPSWEDRRSAEVEKTAKQNSKHQERKTKTKRTYRKKGLDESSLLMDKYWKNLSNEIRHQIDSDAPRRSHRNRRLAAEVLRNNPDISCHTEPRYVMPTIRDVLKYCQLSNITVANTKKKSKTSKAAKAKIDMKSQKDVPPTTSSEERKELGNGTKRGRGRPSKKNQLQKDTFDSDGFRIPPVPSNGQPGTSSFKATDHPTETNCSSNSGHQQGVSIDSGLSSAAMLSDDVTETPQLVQPSSSKMTSKPIKKPVPHPPEAPPCSSASPSPTEIMAEKRKTLDWMMMLMEKRENSPVSVLPVVQIQGFTHLSLEHLTFEERDGIEYSFYVYSNGDNFGFLRFPPAAEKKSTRTKRCSLKFLILSGSLKFIINDIVVNAVGGDFLMIPTNTSYRIVNGPETTLMFMIKTSVSTNT